MSAPPPLVLTLVGTDHHPFDRLVQWADLVALRHPEVRVLTQYGASRPPTRAEGRPFLGHDELLELLRAARVVICHAGPGTLMDARDAGHVAVCVPRDPDRGEHVDGHQVRFAELMSGTGLVHTVADRADLHRAVDDALVRGPAASRARVLDPSTRAARELLARELDELLARPSGARRQPQS